MDSDIKYNYTEILRLRRELEAHIKVLLEEVNKSTKKIEHLAAKIALHDQFSQGWILEIPENFLRDLIFYNLRKKSTDNLPKRSIKWKKLVMGILADQQFPMTSSLLYHKLKHKVDIDMDKRSAIKNISAALSVLEQEGKLVKKKIAASTSLFGFYHFLDSVGNNFKDEYLKIYKLESEGNIE